MNTHFESPKSWKWMVQGCKSSKQRPLKVSDLLPGSLLMKSTPQKTWRSVRVQVTKWLSESSFSWQPCDIGGAIMVPRDDVISFYMRILGFFHLVALPFISFWWKEFPTPPRKLTWLAGKLWVLRGDTSSNGYVFVFWGVNSWDSSFFCEKCAYMSRESNPLWGWSVFVDLEKTSSDFKHTQC